MTDPEPRCVWCRYHEHIVPLEHRCKAGVDLSAILPRNTFGHHYAMPCNSATSPGTVKRTCSKRDLFTPEEVAQQDAEAAADIEIMEKRLLATLPLLEQIKTRHARFDASGRSDCPVCGVVGGVAWTHAKFNGHVSMRCVTQDCIAFME